MTHALDTVADGLRLPPEFQGAPRAPLIPLPEPAAVSAEVRAVWEEVAAFYAMDRPPAVFRWMARDPVFLRGYWGATREAFSDGALDRPMKEVLALAASMTARSEYGIDLHLREARRLGLSEQGVTEAIEVVQLFNTVTKIADTLLLGPDFDPRAAAATAPD